MDNISIPEFSEFIVTPRSETCTVIDETRIMVEILGGLDVASQEFSLSMHSRKLVLGGDIALVIRYRTKKGEYRPACTISFDTRNGGIHIRQIQGSKDREVAFRFHSSFDTIAFFLRFIEDSFIKNGIPVTTERYSEGSDGASHSSKAAERYELFRAAVEGLTEKYQLQEKTLEEV